MRFCLYTDCHFSEFSSIVRSQGKKYSTRLENLIASINWAEKLAVMRGCDEIICLGDFFDRSDLNSREITALNEIEWALMPHTYLVGNHDASTKNLLYNSVNVLKKYNFNIINTVTLRHLEKCDFLFIPYLLDSDRKSIKEYFDGYYAGSKINRDAIKRVVLSHNDVKGLQYGGFQSKNGFDIEDIEANCNLFLNGHLHNSNKNLFAKHAINLGNLTGQNFSEDALTYLHRAYILDTTCGTLDAVENPYALNFYKFNISDDNELKNFQENIFSLKNNAVLSIKCNSHYKESVKELLLTPAVSEKILEQRIILSIDQKNIESVENQEILHNSDDYLLKFISFCKENISNTPLLDEELQEICAK